MLLQPSDDQEFFRETTARFLAERAPVSELRRLRDDPRGFDPAYWRQGAELGWTTLLVAEEHGGGSVSGAGLVDLTLVAHELGRRAAPGPLGPANVVAGALSAHDAHHDVITGLVGGDATASWAHAEGRHGGLGEPRLEITVDGDDLVLDGVKRPVESAAAADHLLVTGRTGHGLTQVLVPTDASGLAVEPLQGVDLTRRFSVVRCAGVRVPATSAVGEVGGAAPALAEQLLRALVIVNAESVGAMQAAFDLTMEWAFDRYSFGRPLASYQALKHRLADMTSWLEASHAIADEAAAAVAAGAPDGPELASAAKAFIGDRGSELLQECVQLHGGIGLTYEHDIHLFLRRVTVGRALHGTPADHRRRLAALLAAEDAA